MGVVEITEGAGINVYDLDPANPVVRSLVLRDVLLGVPFLATQAARIPHRGLELWLDADRSNIHSNLANALLDYSPLPHATSDGLPLELVPYEGHPFDTASNGSRVWLSFDGVTAQRGTFNALAALLPGVHSDEYTIYSVLARDSGIDGHRLVGNTMGATRGFALYANDDDTLGYDVMAGIDFVARATIPVPGDSQLYCVSIISDPQNATPGDRVKAWVNGDGPTADNVADADPENGAPAYDVVIGGTPDTPPLNWQGQLAELLVFHHLHSDTDREAVEAYLMWKWGIA